jgi:hypothetical protein
MQPAYTRVAGKDVPIEWGPLTKVYFCGHCEWWDPAGFYDFWTIENDKKKVTGRWPAGGDPGDRFRKMENDPDYKSAWPVLQTAVRVRPSLLKEVQKWLHGHPGDAPCAQFGEGEGQSFKVKRRSIIKVT